jgi:hypothetical protein
MALTGGRQEMRDSNLIKTRSKLATCFPELELARGLEQRTGCVDCVVRVSDLSGKGEEKVIKQKGGERDRRPC